MADFIFYLVALVFTCLVGYVLCRTWLTICAWIGDLIGYLWAKRG